MSALCIWVVDDDPSVGPALRRMLHAHDIDCRLLTSAGELLSDIGSSLPTFVLLDIHMPGASGIDALRAMRARGIAVPTVMMTGVEREGTRADCFAAGAAEVLAKPVNARTIADLLDRFAGPAPQDATP
jgi:two-component system, LuxR family, response regulator FixJ